MGEEELSTYDPPVPADLLGSSGKKSKMTGIRPDLQPDVEQFSPYSIDPALSDYDPFESIHALTGGNEAPPPPPQPQGNPYIAQILKRMFELRQGMGATGLAAVDIPASLPAQIGGGLTYGVSRAFGANPERAQQLSEYASTPLSYLEPGKLAQTFANNTMGQGTQAYENTFPSQVMGLIDKYGATPAKEMLVSKFGMSPQDADQLVNNAPLIVGGAFKFGKPNIKLKAWGEELRPTPTPIEPSEPPMGVMPEHEPFLDAVKKDLSNGHDPEQLHSQLLNKGLDRQSANEVISEAQRQQSLEQNVGTDQSVGAAAVDPITTIRTLANDASPEVQQVLKNSPAENINVDALLTHTLEKKHGINLTEGQRTNNVNMHTSEWNNRQAHPETLGPLFESQPKQIFEALDRTKEQVAPDIYDSSPSQIGQHEIDALTKSDTARVAKIDAAYQALKDKWQELRGTTGTDDFPVDGKKFLENTQTELKNELLHHDVPDSISKILDELKENNGQMGFSQFLKLNQKLGQKMKEGNGSERAAAYVIRQELQKIPLLDEAAQLKPMADNAISLAKERFDTIKTNPAYKAAIKEAADVKEAASNESLNAEKFHKKFVTGATSEAVRRMKAEIPEGDIAHQAMAAGEIENLKRSSGYTGEGAPNNFSPTGNTKYLRDQNEKLLDIFGPEGRKNLTEINMLGNKIGQPKTGAFNYSNSTSSLIGEMLGKSTGTGLESLAAAHTHGASIPIVQIGKQWFQNAKNKKFGERAVNPTSGIVNKE